MHFNNRNTCGLPHNAPALHRNTYGLDGILIKPPFSDDTARLRLKPGGRTRCCNSPLMSFSRPSHHHHCHRQTWGATRQAGDQRNWSATQYPWAKLLPNGRNKSLLFARASPRLGAPVPRRIRMSRMWVSAGRTRRKGCERALRGQRARPNPRGSRPSEGPKAQRATMADETQAADPTASTRMPCGMENGWPEINAPPKDPASRRGARKHRPRGRCEAKYV